MTGTTPQSSTQADIRARVSGSTAGVVQQGRQSVFASSTAPATSKADRGKGKARSSAARNAPAVSERSALSEVWSGVTSTGSSPSLESAASIDGGSGGPSTGVVIAGIAILGLGLAAITGGALLTAARPRRAVRSGGAPKNE